MTSDPSSKPMTMRAALRAAARAIRDRPAPPGVIVTCHYDHRGPDPSEEEFAAAAGGRRISMRFLFPDNGRCREPRKLPHFEVQEAVGAR